MLIRTRPLLNRSNRKRPKPKSIKPNIHPKRLINERRTPKRPRNAPLLLLPPRHIQQRLSTRLQNKRRKGHPTRWTTRKRSRKLLINNNWRQSRSPTKHSSRWIHRIPKQRKNKRSKE